MHFYYYVNFGCMNCFRHPVRWLLKRRSTGLKIQVILSRLFLTFDTLRFLHRRNIFRVPVASTNGDRTILLKTLLQGSHSLRSSFFSRFLNGTTTYVYRVFRIVTLSRKSLDSLTNFYFSREAKIRVSVSDNKLKHETTIGVECRYPKRGHIDS